jgi:hypothetical protein
MRSNTCDDGDPCTSDTCDVYTGACIHGDLCPSDNCSTTTFNSQSGNFEVALVDCMPANLTACYVFGCDPNSGCYIYDLYCEDNDTCTRNDCNDGTGCVFHYEGCQNVRKLQ